MENFHIQPGKIDLSSVRRYSLAVFDSIDFSTSDDFAIVVESLKNLIILKKDLQEIWSEENEQNLWQFVIDPDLFMLACYMSSEKLSLSFTLPNTPVNEFFYFIKSADEKLNSEDYDLKLIYGFIRAPYLESLYEMLHKTYFPIFSENVKWSDCIKTEYVDHQLKFSSQLFYLKNELISELVFYVPENVQNASISSDDKELLNEIERAVINWIWLLINLLMRKSCSEFNERNGPIEEIKFWEEKKTILSNALKQLDRDDVKKCIEILRNKKSGCLPKLTAVHQQLSNEIDLASQNVNFLSILKKPCELIDSAALSDIPKHFNLLLNSVRIIWKYSPHFKSDSEISSLICKVNDFVIQACSKHIPLDSIFSETSTEQNGILNNVIHCCKFWIHFFKMSEKAYKKFARDIWSVESIASSVNLFILRCDELIKICDYKKQFKCEFIKNKYVKGHKCFELAEQFEAVESYFWVLLRKLAKNKNCCLDIHTTEWYDHFKKFQEEIRDLEVTVIKLMTNSFNNITEIEEGIQVLKMFEKYFEKEVMKRDLRKCINFLYDAFFIELSSVKKRIVKSKKFTNPLLPNFGGAALNLSLLPIKLKLQYQILKSTSHLWSENGTMNLDEHYQQVLEAVDESIHTLFLQWIKSIPKDAYEWLKCPIVVQKDICFIGVNIDSIILILIEELYYWDKIGVEIPHHTVQLHEKSEIYWKRVYRIIQTLQNCNVIYFLLSKSTDGLFDDALKSLRETVLPIFKDLNWSSSQVTFNASLRNVSEQTKSVNDTFSCYEEITTKIFSSCKRIKDKSFFSNKVKSSFEFSEFIQFQETYKKSVLMEIKDICLSIVSLAKKLQNVYKKKKPDDVQFCEMFMAEVGDHICKSLVESFSTSLKVVAALFGLNRKNKMRSLFSISLSLKDKQMNFQPSFKDICYGINDYLENMKNDLAVLLDKELFIDDSTIKDKFQEKIEKSAEIKKIRDDIEYGLSKLHEAQVNYTKEWEPFSSLWKTDKSEILLKYKAAEWKASCFEDDINRFMDIARKVPYIQRFKLLEFCICDCCTLKNMIIACAEDWKKELGQVFDNIMCSNLQNAYNLFELASKMFSTIPYSLKDLKCCLIFLINAKASSLKVHSTFNLIHEIFLTLVKLGIPVIEKALDQKRNLEKNWKDLEKSFNVYNIKLQKVQALHLRHFLSFHKILQKQADTLQEDLHSNGPFCSKFNNTDALRKILLFRNCLIDYKEKEFQMKIDSKFFHVTLDPLCILKSIENELDNLKLVWIYATQIDQYVSVWRTIPVLSFVVAERQSIIDEFKKLINGLRKEIKGTHWLILEELLLRLQELEETLLIIMNFQESTLQERHWNSLKDILELQSIDFFQTEKFSFEFIENLKIENFSNKLETIVSQARKEFEIEQMLKKMADTWEKITFDLSLHDPFYKLESCENILSVIEDHQTALETVKTSKYMSYFSDDIDSLGNSLCLVLDVIDQASIFQRKFFYLENVFSECTVQAQLPKESVEFQNLSLLWQNISVSMNIEKFAWIICHKEGFLEALGKMNEDVQIMQKSLEAYLESKRRVFPRFYLISDDDLLSIIGQKLSKNIELHLEKFFSGLNLLEIMDIVEEKGRHQEIIMKAVGMHSRCNEYVEFCNSIDLNGPIESWMLDIEIMMYFTLNALLQRCLQVLMTNINKESFNFVESKWLYNWPGQVCLLSTQIVWTTEVTACIKAVQESAVIMPLKNLKKKWKEILSLFIKKLANETHTMMYLKCMMMIITLVNMCDIIDYLIKCVCNDPNAFEWLAQLRYYYDNNKEECMIQQTKAVLKYGFEYLGNRRRLVLTPLTERCFVSITTAFLLQKGVLIKGSKSTGKTETLRELGSMIGIYVLMINCSEGLTHMSVLRMLSGLAQIGAWAVFEEFGFVSYEVLSILTQQINVIFQALSLDEKYYLFMGKENSLDEKFGMFLVMNTDYNKYNYSLSTLLSDTFRLITLTSPDILTVIEVYFNAFCFKDYKSAAKDVNLIFKMFEEQLSVQHHYDFGLCTVISFLANLGKVKKIFVGTSTTQMIATSFEMIVLPKLLPDDVPIFKAILDNVLGSVKTAIRNITHIKSAVEDAFSQKSLQVSENMVKKVIELHDIMSFHHSVILLGNSGCGKSTTWKILKDVCPMLETPENLDSKDVSVHTDRFNPKSFSPQELFGYFDDKGDWIDGLFSSVLRKACNVQAKLKWIILEGPVDFEWIKNISSLLDNSKVLTLASGERILLPKEVYLIIETAMLTHCCPAAVSRCGIVYHEANSISWEAYFYTWLEKVENKTMSKMIGELADKYLDAVIEFPYKSFEKDEIVFTTNIYYVASFCKVMDSLLKKITDESNIEGKVSRIFWFSTVWSVGCTASTKGQHLFDEFICNLNHSFPSKGSAFNYGLDENLEWIEWSDLFPSWNPNDRCPLQAIVVPTKMTVAYNYVVKKLLDEMHPVFFTGKMGSGKSTVIRNFLNSLNPEKFKYTMWNVSCQSSSMKLQCKVENQMIKKAGNIFIPNFGRKVIIFLDDLNLVIPDEYGCVSFLELLTMLLNCNYWFDRENWKANRIQNAVFFCAMSSVNSSNNHPSQSLLNKFNVININPPSEADIKHIFTSYMKYKFPNPSLEMRILINAISIGSLDILKVAACFSPSPSKLHYLFNMQNIKKVIFRILDLNPECFSDKMRITKFWSHECLREFSDSMISEEDRCIFLQNLCDIVEHQFLTELSCFKAESKPLFVKFLNPSEGYEEVKDLSVFTKNIENYLKGYKRIHRAHTIVLSDHAVKHLCQVIRGIEVPYGNMFLTGISGTGKLTTSRLAAHILKYELFEIHLRKEYGITHFRLDLCELLYKCGVKKKNVVFLITDFQAMNNEFLPYLSEILCGEEFTDLLKKSDLEKIYAELMEKSEFEITEKIDYNKVFIENVKRHLHVVLSVNYGTSFFRKCIIHYPAVYKNSTCVWFGEWPKMALESIAKKVISDLDVVKDDKACYQTLAEIHDIMMRYFKNKMKSSIKLFHTSASFITYANTFKSVFIKKRKKVCDSVQRLESGLIKIKETEEKVNEIARETEEARKTLVQAEKKCDEALIDIEAKKSIVAEKQKAIQEKKTEIEKNEKICKNIADAAQQDLNIALPALEDARKALEALNKRDIGEIKSYAKPPVLVEMVLEAVMILRNSEPSWAEAKRQLGNPAFLKELIEFDRDNILDSSLKKVGIYLKKDDFNPLAIGKVSVAAKSLCIWVKAIHSYGEIYKKVKPKKERLRVAQEELAALQKILSDLLKELHELQTVIENLQKEHDLLQKKKEEYASTARILTLKLERANNIMKGLSSEKERWNNKTLVLSEKKKCVLGDSFIAAGYIAYLGPHDPNFRLKTYNLWKKIVEKHFISSLDFSMSDFFVDETVITEWAACGLPSDQYSHEGAAIVTESYCCPFIIDPEGQAVKWIKNMETKQGLKFCNLEGSKWISILESAIVEGYPVILQSMNGQLDSALEPLFDKTNLTSVIKFNNKELMLHGDFFFYIFTKSPKPQFSQLLIKRMCIVNFTIKEKGLEDQLLPLVVRNERPDLEITKDKLVKNIREGKKQLLDCENTILTLLNKSEGSLLEDELLVEALNKSKSISNEVEEKLISSEKTEAVIDAAREKYRPGAKNAAILYFVLNDMTLIDSIYIFTLDSYINLFLDSINNSPKDVAVIRRIRKLKQFHQYSVFKYACRTVSEKHSLLLSFHMCCQILKAEGNLDEAEYEFFIYCGQAFDPKSDPPNPCQQWLPQNCWEHITQLERVPKFIGITISFDEMSKNWQEWYLTSEPEKVFLPGNWRNICSEFQKLLIVRCLRADRITNCVRIFVQNNLGKRFLEYSEINLKEIVRQSAASRPVILFNLSSVDIESTIAELADEFGMSDKYRVFYLGKGQGPAATQLILDAAKLGFWACISNCHLLPSWMQALEKIVSKLEIVKVNQDFRLFLSSPPTSIFPASILQNCIVLTFDAPKGIRDNMLKLYHTDILYKTNKEHGLKYRRLLFSLSFFHSVLVEINKFQDLGWNANYNFSVADFRSSVKMLQLYVDELKEIPWEALKNSIADICYRNHLTNQVDGCLLMTYYEQYFCDEACLNMKFQLADLESYYIPEDGPFENYIMYLKNLPHLDVPEVFGQHPNSEIPYRIQEGEKLLKHLNNFQSRTSITDDINESQIMKVIKELKQEVPNVIDEKKALNILKEKTEPFNFILLQETQRYNYLINYIKKSLNDLEDNITGKQKITERFEILMKFIQNMKVPLEWQFTYPSLKALGSWIQDLKLRVDQLYIWCSCGEPPIKFWLSGFTCPKSVLNATLLITVKKNDIMLKDIQWEYHVSTLDEAHIKEAPAEGIYVKGLFLEGAGWDKTNSILTEPEPLYLTTVLPVIHFKPVIESSMRGLYTCPCYYTSKKMNDTGNSYLFNIELKTKKPEEHWIKRGTAVILANSD